MRLQDHFNDEERGWNSDGELRFQRRCLAFVIPLSPLLKTILHGSKKNDGHTSWDDVGEGGKTGTLF